jgi:hypothetical protein
MHPFSLLYLLPVLLILWSCTSAPKKPEPTGKYGTYRSSPNGMGQYNEIDIDNLMQELKIADNKVKVGYQEKSFDTCKVQSNFSSNPLCERLYLGVLHFQMVCRTNDAIVKRKDMLPLQSQNIRWKRGYLRGLASTDEQGYGTIKFITDVSSLFRPVIFRFQGHVVFKRLKDQWQMVLPNHWCDLGSSTPL